MSAAAKHAIQEKAKDLEQWHARRQSPTQGRRLATLIPRTQDNGQFRVEQSNNESIVLLFSSVEQNI